MVKTVETTALAEKLTAALKAKKGREKPAPEVTAARKAANDAECIKVFTKAGYTDVQPRVNVLTYGKPAKDGKPASGWIAKGRRVKRGQEALIVGPFRLFHFDQTELDIAPATAESTVH